ncbi:MAG: DUF4430 domain-containing protein [Ruminococcaceae bacterium]|nr:DUF4430 domain-containing protein [Oscillospiraceae bacterium]
MFKRLISLALCAMMVFALASCGGGGNGEVTTESNIPAEIHCNVTVKIAATDTKGEEILIDNLPIILRNRTEWPTILDALAQACSAYEIKYSASEDGSTVGTIKNYANFATDSTGATCFWEWTKNGKTPDSGKAGDTLVTDGDVYVFTYTRIGGSEQ